LAYLNLRVPISSSIGGSRSDHITELVSDLDSGAVRDVALSKIGSHQPSESNGIFLAFEIAPHRERGHIDLIFAAIANREQTPKI